MSRANERIQKAIENVQATQRAYRAAGAALVETQRAKDAAVEAHDKAERAFFGAQSELLAAVAAVAEVES